MAQYTRPPYQRYCDMANKIMFSLQLIEYLPTRVRDRGLIPDGFGSCFYLTSRESDEFPYSDTIFSTVILHYSQYHNRGNITVFLQSLAMTSTSVGRGKRS